MAFIPIAVSHSALWTGLWLSLFAEVLSDEFHFQGFFFPPKPGMEQTLTNCRDKCDIRKSMKVKLKLEL